MSLCSDRHYLVKVFHWGELYSTDSKGIHGSVKAKKVLIPDARDLRTGRLGKSLVVAKNRQRVRVSFSRWVGKIS